MDLRTSTTLVIVYFCITSLTRTMAVSRTEIESRNVLENVMTISSELSKQLSKLSVLFTSNQSALVEELLLSFHKSSDINCTRSILSALSKLENTVTQKLDELRRKLQDRSKSEFPLSSNTVVCRNLTHSHLEEDAGEEEPVDNYGYWMMTMVSPFTGFIIFCCCALVKDLFENKPCTIKPALMSVVSNITVLYLLVLAYLSGNIPIPGLAALSLFLNPALLLIAVVLEENQFCCKLCLLLFALHMLSVIVACYLPLLQVPYGWSKRMLGYMFT